MVQNVLSPASGRVVEIITLENDREIMGEFIRISIFLAFWDNHTTCAPVSGHVERLKYTPGKFFSALGKKAGSFNENNLIWISNGNIRLAVRQIAGRFAKRIVCRCREGQRLSQGEEIGSICFGSRVQIYLPSFSKIAAGVGQKVKTGKTVLALFDPASGIGTQK